ncbi:putative Zn-dependent peptidase [Saprospira grandis DSM 2844]|uniref:Putative Zn-dependent peptidase n=1 Tax=Saprospira grandis DSM 2844 TaxID=694433 RepID=J1I2H9_9BACT|nr:M16 family metallopeptidase [Saprospira grandis]EJF52905.1 putative Zn-dependent peptidase [Saprospira grandis DSM 2844]
MSSKISIFSCLLSLCCLSWSCSPSEKKTEEKEMTKYQYETVENDPLGTKIYTLKNGLKVYMSVNKDEPRIQTYIATRAGSKNDPADATGLAHYLEHMLFKGSSKIGALDWEKEKPMLDEISVLYEEHFKADPEARKAIYKKIDSLSFEAAKLVAANEYDKMISQLGAKGTNAYTSLDQTVYVNDIPSNELERWMKVESERFGELVLRLFHTELEAVYEEFNIGQSNDGRKVFQAFMSGLLPNHPYGTQTTIGTSEHLKRPSMVKIHEFFNTYYVPNNMAIVLAGDFDPDQTVELIEKYFGGYESKEVPQFEKKPLPERKEMIVKEVVGQEAAVLDMGWVAPGAGTDEALIADIAMGILSNGKAGLIDLNLVQKQAVGSNSMAFCWTANDYSFLGIYAYPKPGQSLEEAKELVLEQVRKLKAGEFEDWMIEAVINDMEYRYQKSLESNRGRAGQMLDAFISNQDWATVSNKFARMRKFSKQQITDFAKTYMGEDNGVVVFKREGQDDNISKVDKPSITAVEPAKDTLSTFRQAFEEMPSQNLSPQFVDFKEAIQQSQLKGKLPFDYVQNKTNETFSLYYILEMGSQNDKVLPIAVRYLPFLGTDKYSPEQLQQEFFKLGLSFDVYTSGDVSYVTLRGLDRSFQEGVTLFEHILAHANPNEEALKNLVAQIKKDRLDAKKDKRQILNNAMFNYARYGEKSPFRDILSFEEMDALTAKQLVDKIKSLTQYEHSIFYYGSQEQADIAKVLEMEHKIADQLLACPKRPDFKELATEKDQVIFVPFAGMPQAEIMMVSKGTEGFNLEENIMSQLYNEYFGAGLSSIVFQEIREKRALAYSAYAFNSSPVRADDSHYFRAFVGTQSDKIKQAIPAMKGIIEEVPVVEDQLNNAIGAILKKLEADRLKGSDVYWTYRSNKKRGYTQDLRKDSYEFFSGLNVEGKGGLEAFNKFHKAKIKDRKYTVLVLGDKSRMDTDYLKSLGDYKELSVDQVFGY